MAGANLLKKPADWSSLAAGIEVNPDGSGFRLSSNGTVFEFDTDEGLSFLDNNVSENFLNNAGTIRSAAGGVTLINAVGNQITGAFMTLAQSLAGDFKIIAKINPGSGSNRINIGVADIDWSAIDAVYDTYMSNNSADGIMVNYSTTYRGNSYKAGTRTFSGIETPGAAAPFYLVIERNGTDAIFSSYSDAALSSSITTTTINNCSTATMTDLMLGCSINTGALTVVMHIERVEVINGLTRYSSSSPVATMGVVALPVGFIVNGLGDLVEKLDGTAGISPAYNINNAGWSAPFATYAAMEAFLLANPITITDGVNSVNVRHSHDSDATEQAEVFLSEGPNLTGGAGGSPDFPAEADVRLGVDYDNAVLTGSLIVPAVSDVRDGVGVDATTGTYEPADEADVLLAVQYGAGGTEFTGSLLRYAVPTDAGDTIRQQIMDTIATRLATILISNGYKTNAGSNVYPWREFGLPDTKLPAIFFRDTNDEPEQFTVGNVDNVLTVEVTATSAKSATSDQQVREMIADVIKAVGVDETWGNLAEFTLLPDAGMAVEELEKTTFSAQIDLRVEYQTARFNPFGR